MILAELPVVQVVWHHLGCTVGLMVKHTIVCLVSLKSGRHRHSVMRPDVGPARAESACTSRMASQARRVGVEQAPRARVRPHLQYGIRAEQPRTDYRPRGTLLALRSSNLCVNKSTYKNGFACHITDV